MKLFAPFCLTFMMVSSLSIQAQDIAMVDDLYESGDFEKAVVLAEQVAEKADKENDFTTLIKTRSRIIESSIELGDEVTLNKYLDSCLTCFDSQELSYYRIYSSSSSLFKIAQAYMESGDIDEALKYQKRALLFQDVSAHRQRISLEWSNLSKFECLKGDYVSALNSVEKGFELLPENSSIFVQARMIHRKAVCLEAVGRKEEADKLYEDLKSIIEKTPENTLTTHYTEVYMALAERSFNERDTAATFKYAGYALKNAKLYADRELESQVYTLYGKCYVDTDPELSARYADMADSLSYEPYLRQMFGKVALYNLEYPRYERDVKIRQQQDRINMLVVVVSMLALIILLVLQILINRTKETRYQKDQIAVLKKNLEQRDRLLFIANNSTNPEVKRDIENVAKDIVDDLPVKLTARELEIARMAAADMMNKEIAAKLGISTRTVETHRNNVYHKLGISNLAELKYYINALDNQ